MKLTSPKRKQGAKLLRSLSGMAALAVEHLEFEDIASEDGVRNIMSRLKEFFLPHLEVSLPRAFEAAVYGKPRQSAESFPEYIARMERAFHRLSKEGVELLEGASGYIMYRQASLSEAHEQRLLTWCDGHYDKSSIVKALRKLDKVVKDKNAKREDYVFVAEGDLDAVYSESEMLEALASYKEVREALRNQRNGRGYYGRDHFKGKDDLTRASVKNMSGLVERVGRLLTSREEEKVKDVKMKSYARKPKMAVRNWRVLLDKLFTLLAFVERQQLIQEWLPELHSLSGPSMLQSKEEDSLEACYQKIIINAKVLHPLKSKEAPTVSMSTCVHPKAQLKGGGNKSASYIYCKMCHCRWESPLTAADIKEDLKKGKKGLLSQKMEEARTEQEVKVPAKEKEVSEKEQAEMWQELRRQRVDLQEKEVHIEAMMRALKTQKHELQEMIQKGVIQGAEAPAKKTQGKLPEEETPQCLCNEMAVKASRVDERTLEEKFFWVCKWGNCDFFQREPMKAIKDKAPSEMSFQMLGSTASSSHRGRRSKSPRLEKRTNRGETIPVPDSD
ncbi:unnamed protein product [Durusdinium trenchii]|uniref:Uncharacterized protein n=1 Tax=Durusdinium trenchii TaxID=1381693 RepID=A0ABP0QYL6_9DINO